MRNLSTCTCVALHLHSNLSLKEKVKGCLFLLKRCISWFPERYSLVSTKLEEDKQVNGWSRPLKSCLIDWVSLQLWGFSHLYFLPYVRLKYRSNTLYTNLFFYISLVISFYFDSSGAKKKLKFMCGLFYWYFTCMFFNFIINK